MQIGRGNNCGSVCNFIGPGLFCLMECKNKTVFCLNCVWTFPKLNVNSLGLNAHRIVYQWIYLFKVAWTAKSRISSKSCEGYAECCFFISKNANYNAMTIRWIFEGGFPNIRDAETYKISNTLRCKILPVPRKQFDLSLPSWYFKLNLGHYRFSVILELPF